MSIDINRDVILTGPVTRFELDGTDLGPTLGAVVIRRETEHTEIVVDSGGTIERFRNRDRMFIEFELASGSLRNLEIAWGGQVTESTSSSGTVASRTLPLNRSNVQQRHHELIIEGTDKADQFRRYVFRKIVSLVQTNQSMSRDGIAGIALEFEVLVEPLRPQNMFGEVVDLRISAYAPGSDVTDDPVPDPSWIGTPKATIDLPYLPRRDPDPIVPDDLPKGPEPIIPADAPQIVPQASTAPEPIPKIPDDDTVRPEENEELLPYVLMPYMPITDADIPMSVELNTVMPRMDDMDDDGTEIPV